MRWRRKLAEVAGLPPLDLMDGFFDGEEYGTLYFGQKPLGDVWKSKREDLEQTLPISWDCLKPSALHELLNHSDCDGQIESSRCGPIADALEALLPLLPSGDATGHIGNWRDKTAAFVSGLRLAAERNEPLTFG
jgi:hypothetical protein